MDGSSNVNIKSVMSSHIHIFTAYNPPNLHQLSNVGLAGSSGRKAYLILGAFPTSVLTGKAMHMPSTCTQLVDQM